MPQGIFVRGLHMGLFDFIKSELIDIIEWLDDTNNTLVYRFERHDNEIKNNAQLIVREGQKAIFVSGGKLADVFEPGTYTLSTQNMPLMATLNGWKYGFDSPFKAEVYFVSTRQKTDMGWGTPSPIMYRDPEFGAIQIRGFGNYAFRIEDPTKFFKEVVGTDGRFEVEEIENQLRSIVSTRTIDAIAESKMPVLDMSTQYNELGELVKKYLGPELLESYGLQVTQFIVQSITLPEEVQEALNKKSSMNILGNLNQYTQFQAANAMEDAANNPGEAGGMASAGVGMGMGMGMAGMMNQALNQPQQPAQQAAPAPPPPPAAVAFHILVNQQQLGPFDMATLPAYVSNGQLTRETLVWKAGMAGWEAASTVGQLQALFGATPPPPPPPPAP